MRRYVNTIEQAGERKSMRNQPGYVYPPAEYQVRGLLLELHRGAVTTYKLLLFHAYPGGVDRNDLLGYSLREEKHPPPPSHVLLGCDNYLGHRRGDDREVGTTTLGDACKDPLYGFLLRVQREVRTQLTCDTQPAFHQVQPHDRATFAARSLGQEQTDRALPENEYHFAGRQLRRFQRLQARIQRLQETGFLEADLLGNLHRPAFDNPIHGPNVLCEASSCRLEACGSSGATVDLTLRV